MARQTSEHTATLSKHSFTNVLFALNLAAAFLLVAPHEAHSQESGSTIDTTAVAGEADAEQPKRRFVKWNEFDGPVSTVRFGLNFMYDFASYSQDEESKQQVDLVSDNGLRDFRFVLSGKFKTQRPITWTLGYMYDGAEDEWRFRMTGVQVDLPEISGRVFVGRQKEGYSMIKVMSGINIWGIERSQTLDAFVPILADGIKYLGYYPRQRVFLQVGAYSDVLSEKQKFSTYDDQLVTRVGWQPILSDEDRSVLHVALMARRTHPDEGAIREKSKPGSYLAPNFLDTGTFPSDRSQTYGFEAFYRKGPWLWTAEYDWQLDHATNGGDPMFHGGNATAVWLITGETRTYNERGAYFNGLSPTRTVFEGGRGAVEAGVDMTYNDFNDGSFQGGKYRRLTPFVAWYLTDVARITFAYGLGKLERFGVTGTTQFFQARLHLMI